ncbi:PREDICTED: uncharacterized protein LOC101386763 [Odobenus rosmarus divergens]|uniref:Uncharacterized protein LOC101386763 n=1 Tax=Odobenus rosmarus divergens TaxID=9708 RepID=A0A9B0M0D7_ODORO
MHSGDRRKPGPKPGASIVCAPGGGGAEVAGQVWPVGRPEGAEFNGVDESTVPQAPRHGQCVQVSLSFVGPLLYSPGHTAQALNHTRSLPLQGLCMGRPGGVLPVWQGNVSPRTQPRALSTLFPSLSGSNCHLDTCRVPEVPRMVYAKAQVLKPTRPDVLVMTPWFTPIIWDGVFDSTILDAQFQNATIGLTVFAIQKYTPAQNSSPTPESHLLQRSVYGPLRAMQPPLTTDRGQPPGQWPRGGCSVALTHSQRRSLRLPFLGATAGSACGRTGSETSRLH